MSEKEARDYWSDCGQIFFHHSGGYGITSELRNIYLAKEEDILRALETGELGNELHPIHLPSGYLTC